MWMISNEGASWETKFVQTGTALSGFVRGNDDWAFVSPDAMDLIRQAIIEGRNYVDLRKVDENYVD